MPLAGLLPPSLPVLGENVEVEGCLQIELPLERGDLSRGARDKFEVNVNHDLGQLEGLTVSIHPSQHPAPWHLSHVEVCCPSGASLLLHKDRINGRGAYHQQEHRWARAATRVDTSSELSEHSVNQVSLVAWPTCSASLLALLTLLVQATSPASPAPMLSIRLTFHSVMHAVAGSICRPPWPALMLQATTRSLSRLIPVVWQGTWPTLSSSAGLPQSPATWQPALTQSQSHQALIQQLRAMKVPALRIQANQLLALARLHLMWTSMVMSPTACPHIPADLKSTKRMCLLSLCSHIPTSAPIQRLSPQQRRRLCPGMARALTMSWQAQHPLKQQVRSPSCSILRALHVIQGARPVHLCALCFSVTCRRPGTQWGWKPLYHCTGC